MPTKATIDQDRLASIKHLASGVHKAGSDEMCVMEAVAYVTHQKWSDHPPCVSPVIGAFMRTWNDGLPGSKRTALLLPIIPKLINTRGSEALEQRRALMAADWLVRTHAVAWLRLAKLDKQADMLAALPEITDFSQCQQLTPTLEAIRMDAAAAWADAGAAAGAAAGDAAGAAWAAWAALAQTKTELRASAVALVERMIALTDDNMTEAA